MGPCFNKPTKSTPIPLLPSTQVPSPAFHNPVLPPLLSSLMAMHRANTISIRENSQTPRSSQVGELFRERSMILHGTDHD